VHLSYLDAVCYQAVEQHQSDSVIIDTLIF
jgi:hypothetical protein